MDAMASRNLAAVIFVPVATFSTACPQEDKSNVGAFGDEFMFELSQAAKMPKTSLSAGLVVSIEAPCPDNRPTGSYPKTGVMSGLPTILPEPENSPASRIRSVEQVFYFLRFSGFGMKYPRRV
jgi:hypothetical protein